MSDIWKKLYNIVHGLFRDKVYFFQNEKLDEDDYQYFRGQIDALKMIRDLMCRLEREERDNGKAN
jgi:hypothetical protein